MKRQHGTIYLIGLSAALGLCLASGTATAEDIAWDLVNSTSQNLVSYTTDAPVSMALGDGFQKFDMDVSPELIPWSLLDQTTGSDATDTIGIIEEAADFDEFFGVCDTECGTCAPPYGGPFHATWVFDISSGSGDLELSVDLAAMGDFEAADSHMVTYQVDSGAVMPFLTVVADEAGSQTYTMADGTVYSVDDPLTVNAVALSNQLTTFSTPITLGSQLTVVLTSLSDGGTEGFVARNIRVTGLAALFTDGFETGTIENWSLVFP